MKTKKVLIIVTNHSSFDNPKVAPTGLWLSELTHAYDEFQEAGMEIEIVSPKGGKIPIDERSLGYFTANKATKSRYNDPQFMALLEDTKSVSDVDSSEYDLLYYAGGHGAMWDYVDNEELQTLTRDMYEGGKVVAAVCHGVASLQNVKLSDGEYLINGKNGTGFAYFDERVIGLKKYVPYNLEKTLKERGMKYSKSKIPLKGHTVVDGRLITGQNPNSSTKTAQKALEVLNQKMNGSNKR